MLGFGATKGAGTTDAVSVPFQTWAASSIVVVSLWYNRNGAGGSSAGNLFSKNISGTILAYRWDNTNTRWQFNDVRATNGIWTHTGGTSTGANTHLLFSYDNSSTSNKPLIWINGVSQTVTTQTTPSGTFLTAASNIFLGNRSDGLRNTDGSLGGFTMWHGTPASQTEATLLAAGINPLDIATLGKPDVLLEMVRSAIDLRNGACTVTGTAVQTHYPKLTLPHGGRRVLLPAAGGTNVDESVALSATASETHSASAAAAATMTAAGTAAQAQAATATTADALALPATSSTSQAAAAAASSSTSLGATGAQAQAGSAAAADTLGLGSTATQGQTGGLLTTGSLDLAATASQAQAASANAAPALSLSAAAGLVAATVVAALGALALDLVAGLSFSLPTPVGSPTASTVAVASPQAASVEVAAPTATTTSIAAPTAATEDA